jgi:hypothetical protein
MHLKAFEKVPTKITIDSPGETILGLILVIIFRNHKICGPSNPSRPKGTSMEKWSKLPFVKKHTPTSHFHYFFSLLFQWIENILFHCTQTSF